MAKMPLSLFRVAVLILGFPVMAAFTKLSCGKVSVVVTMMPQIVSGVQEIWLTGIQPMTGADWDAGISMKLGAEIMLEEINAHPTLLKGYTLKVVWQDGLCAKPVGSNLFYQNLFDKIYNAFAPGISLAELDADGDGVITTSDVEPFQQSWTSATVTPDPIGLLGSGCSGTAINIANVAFKARFPMVSNSATRPSLSDRNAFPNFFRTILPDTFFNDAWLAMAKQLGQTSVVSVIGETENWISMGVRLVSAAASLGMTLVGQDLSGEIPGFSGLQISIDSKAAATDVATELVRLKQRVVILQMFAPRNRLLLCECYKKDYVNVVYMVVGWMAFGWWEVPGPQDCSVSQITSMANYFIAANMMFFRSDQDTVLSCSQSMTVAQWKAKWFDLQGNADGDLSMTGFGFAPALEASTSADAACMYAQMLHDILITKKTATLSDLAARTESAYTEVINGLGAVDFEGIQGRVRFGPNEADPKGSIIIQQLQVSGDSQKYADVGSYNDGVFNFFGKTNLIFQFPSESFPAGPAGASSINAPLTPFAACPPGQTVNFVDNTCQDCPDGEVFADWVGICVCQAGFASSQAMSGKNCGPCPPGTFAEIAGQLTCDICPTGKFQESDAQTSCEWCEVGYYSEEEGSSACELTVRTIWLTAIQPFTGNDWDAGVSMRIGGQIMLEELNKNPDVLKGYELKVVWQDGLCAKTHGTNLFLTNIFDKQYVAFAPGVSIPGLDVDKDGQITTTDTDPLSEIWNSSYIQPDPVGLLGSGCAGTALNIVNFAYKARYPMISNSATRPALSDRSEYPNFFRTILPDTFFAPAWIAMSKQLQQKQIVVVIGETDNWKSMGTAIGKAAIDAGVELVGYDKRSEIPEFFGLQLSFESQAAATEIAKDLVKLKKRVVVLLMFARRNRLLLCEAYKQGFFNAIYMPMGWLAGGWWAVDDGQGCSPQNLTYLAHYFVSANMMMWRADGDTNLDCSTNMTANAFKTEWFKRQGGKYADLSMRDEGYAPATEASTTADAVCMWAKALDQVLRVQKMPLEHVAERTKEAYEAIIEAFASVDFEGVQGRVYFDPGKADPKGKIILQQMVPGGTIVDIASSLSGQLTFMGNRIKFQFAGEDYLAGPKGASSITAPVASFTTCPEKQKLDFMTNECTTCPEGKVFFAGICACSKGSESDGGGCRDCSPGNFSADAGQQCENCAPGSHSPDFRAIECLPCGLGTYQPENGTKACVSCPAGETTIMTGLKENMCNCEKGRYRPVGATSCKSCLEGMTCGFASDAANFKVHGGDNAFIPELSPGYYSEPNKPLSIYKCLTEEACPGGVPGACYDLRLGLLCATCPDDFAPNKETGECDPCSGGLTALTFLTPIIGFIVCGGVYYVANSPLATNASITLTMSVTGGLIVTVIQVLAVFKELSIPWPRAVDIAFDGFSIFVLNADAVSIECSMGSDATVLYAVRILVPILIVIIVFIMYLLSNLIGVIFSKFTTWELDKTFNTIGQIMQTLFIAFAVIVVRPLECFKHPNDDSSMVLFPQVLCWSSDHTPMILLALLEIVLFLGPYATICVWANVKAPAKSLKRGPFMTRFRFLMYRFRPDAWWWGNAYLLRQTLLAFSTSMPSGDPHGQILYTTSVLALYLLVVTRVWPWKNHSLNQLDSSTTLLMLIIISAATAFLPESPDPDHYTVFLIISFLLLAVYILFFITLTGYNIFNKGIFGEFGPETVKNLGAKELTGKWLQLNEALYHCGEEGVESMFRMMNQYDRENLLKSIIIWEATASEFLPDDAKNLYNIGQSFQGQRLQQLAHTTASVDKSEVEADISRRLSDGSERISKRSENNDVPAPSNTHMCYNCQELFSPGEEHKQPVGVKATPPFEASSGLAAYN